MTHIMQIGHEMNLWHKFSDITGISRAAMSIADIVMLINSKLVEHNAVFHHDPRGSHIAFETEEDYVVFKIKFS